MPDYTAERKLSPKLSAAILELFPNHPEYHVRPIVARILRHLRQHFTAMLLTEIFDWTDIFGPLETQLPLVSLGASNATKVLLPETLNVGEFPINIETRDAMVVEPSEPLKWSGYRSQPLAMTMTNDGNTVVLTGLWSSGMRPSLEGGPLNETYDFHSIIFHWGPTDEAGSEHSVNGLNYPLELQLVHVKRGYDSPVDAIVTGTNHGIAIVSFFFQITTVDHNESLDHVVENLWRISQPGTKVSVPRPFPLEGLFSPFEKNYYSYCGGSVEKESCNEVITWIVQPIPSNVSSSQVNKFRTIYLTQTTARSIQRLNERDLYYHD